MSEQKWEDYDSGPFCIHWSGLSDCDEVCACGHKCREHYDSEPCCVCDCHKFKERAPDG